MSETLENKKVAIQAWHDATNDKERQEAVKKYPELAAMYTLAGTLADAEQKTKTT